MVGKRKGVSSEELTSARFEAGRRIARRDERMARRAAHEERVGPFRDAVGVAISRLDGAFPRTEDEDLHHQVSEALVTALLACTPPPEEDDADDAHAPGCAPAPAEGPPTLPELEALLRRACHARDRAAPTDDPAAAAVNQALAEQLRALCDAVRATGTVDESALAECDPRIAAALNGLRVDRPGQEAWRIAPSRRAQPRESLDVLTVRVLVERGRTQFEATKMVKEMSSDEARDSSIRKKVDRAMKAQAKLAAPPEDEELAPEALAELERAMEESSRDRDS
jgi:hypothetical protein